jgi:hypothetical protein
MKRRRGIWAGGILAGLLVGVPLLLWGGYAVLALARHEHFYHGLPSSWWKRQLTVFGMRWDPQHHGVVMGRYFDYGQALSSSSIAPVAEYLGLSMPVNNGGLFSDPAASGVLCDFAQGGDEFWRLVALQQLSKMRLHPDLVIPELIAILKGDRPAPGPGTRTSVLGYLRDFGPTAAPAVPVIIDFLNGKIKAADGEARMDRLLGMQALRAIEPENMDMLIQLLESPYWEVRENAASTLGYNFGPKAQAAVPALLRVYEGKDPRAKRAAALALLRIDPEAVHKAGVPKGYE